MYNLASKRLWICASTMDNTVPGLTASPLYKTKPYITRVIFKKWYSKNHTTIVGIVPFFPVDHEKHTLWFTAYDIMAFVYMDWPYWTTTLIDAQVSLSAQYRKILK